MTKEILALLQLNVEMEGLLRVLAERENPHAADALARKAAEFDAGVKAFLDGVRPVALKEEEAQAVEMPDSFDAAERAAERAATPSAQCVADDAGSDAPCAAAVNPAPRQAGAALGRIFSLNDRYRYSQELFGGSMQRFSDAVGRLSEMDSFAAALAFLVDELGLDLSQPVAKEFADRLADNMPR